jgi:hypothetical protein
MGKNGKGSCQTQVGSKITELRLEKGLAFKNAFDSKKLSASVSKFYAEFRECVFPPATTLFAFLSQVLSPDGSCRDAVARVNAERIANGKQPASPDTGGYCKAREKLPEEFLHELTTDTGASIEESLPEHWLWKGRHAKGVDGSTVTMADTQENQEQYPQQSTQKKGVGFPIARLVVVFSLISGCTLDLAVGPYSGKGTGEHALLRQLLHCFSPGDIAVGDAYYSAYFLLAIFSLLGVDAVFRADGRRRIDFRAGKRLGKKDHQVLWQKPQCPSWMDKETYDNLPEVLSIRECSVTVDRPGFRAEEIVLVTTILDPKYAPKEELGWLYWQRWRAEINLRDLKTTLGMEHILCKTPEMVRKHIWATLLAYNLVRKLICESAFRYDLLPSELSFKGAIQTLNNYRPIWHNCSRDTANFAFNFLLEAIAKMKVGNRPNRIEPRAVKRRPKPFPRLKVQRHQARANLLK